MHYSVCLEDLFEASLTCLGAVLMPLGNDCSIQKFYKEKHNLGRYYQICICYFKIRIHVEQKGYLLGEISLSTYDLGSLSPKPQKSGFHLSAAIVYVLLQLSSGKNLPFERSQMSDTQSCNSFLVKR